MLCDLIGSNTCMERCVQHEPISSKVKPVSRVLIMLPVSSTLTWIDWANVPWRKMDYNSHKITQFYDTQQAKKKEKVTSSLDPT